MAAEDKTQYAKRKAKKRKAALDANSAGVLYQIEAGTVIESALTFRLWQGKMGPHPKPIMGA
jgi:hypothetical protein